ncbi:MAG TPA: ATP-binding protein [Holophaga sp.]|nr:ATP-binding protein [Holophaga sp.]HPS68297.1 ATP-binding protein [Holophaga sp.]
MTDRHSISIRDRHGFERTIPINRPLVLGRQSHSDIILSDSMVSRNHLRVEQLDGKWWVEDLGSSHGTYLDGARIQRAVWSPGSTLRLADGAYYLTLKAEKAFSSEVNLQAILQTAHLLTGEIELDDLLDRTLERLLAISSTDRGLLMLPDEGGRLEAKVQRNLGSGMEKDIHLSMSSVRRVFEQGEAVWIHNVAADEDLMAQQSVLDLQLKTILCLPLMVQGKCIGVVYLDSRRAVTEPVDRATFEAIVSLCAIAIERTRLSQESLRNQVLATVGQVASSIVHDFKNALFVVAGHTQMLGAQTDDPKIQHHVEQILGAVERLSQLSTDVLEYSKVREPKREVVELGAYLETLVEPLRPRADLLGVQIMCEGPACKANLDKHRFARVIENLLANSLDAMDDRSTGTITLTWEREYGGVRFHLADDGKGIPRKVIKRIYEPFFSHGKGKGTGLGMATVKKIIEEHGGTIEVTSEEGIGTQATFIIPDQNNLRGAGEDTANRLKTLQAEVS